MMSAYPICIVIIPSTIHLFFFSYHLLRFVMLKCHRWSFPSDLLKAGKLRHPIGHYASSWKFALQKWGIKFPLLVVVHSFKVDGVQPKAAIPNHPGFKQFMVTQAQSSLHQPVSQCPMKSRIRGAEAWMDLTQIKQQSREGLMKNSATTDVDGAISRHPLTTSNSGS